MDLNISEIAGICDSDKNLLQWKIRKLLIALVTVLLICLGLLATLVFTLVLKKGNNEDDNCTFQDFVEETGVPTTSTTFDPPFYVLEA